MPLVNTAEGRILRVWGASVLLPALLLLSGCAGDPPPPQGNSNAPPAAVQNVGSDLAWEGLYTDARRTVTITREASGLRVELEDNSVVGWSKPYAAAVTESAGTLRGALSDRYATGIELSLEGESLTLTTTREGHENPRTHDLLRVDPDVRARAEAVYREAYPKKTVGFPRRRGELLVTAAVEVREADPARAAALFAAAAELLWPLKELSAGALHEEGRCLMPSRSPKGSWEAAAERFARAAAQRGEIGDTANQAVSIFNQAHCENPAQNKAGSIESALALYERAAELAAAAKRKQLRNRTRLAIADLLHRKAWEGQPNRGGSLTWDRVVGFYRRAVKLREVDGERSELATSLNNLAFALSPSRNPKGSWAETAVTHGRVAALRKASGDTAGWRFSLRQQARCISKHAEEAMTEGVVRRKARGLLRRARVIALRAGDEELVETIDGWLR